MVAYFCREPGPRGSGQLTLGFPLLTDTTDMAKPNYAFARRQRDLAKKQKQEEKRRRKAEVPEAQPDTPAASIPPKNNDDTPAV